MEAQAEKNGQGCEPSQENDLVGVAQSCADKLTAAEYGKLPPKPGSRPRGRPTGQRLVEENPAGVEVPGDERGGGDGAPDAGFRIDPQIVARTVRAVVKTADSFIVRKVETAAKGLGADSGVVETFGQAAALPNEAADLITETVPILLEKYGVNANAAPEIALLIALGTWSSTVGGVLQQLAKLEKCNKPKPVQASP